MPYLNFKLSLLRGHGALIGSWNVAKLRDQSYVQRAEGVRGATGFEPLISAHN